MTDLALKRNVGRDCGGMALSQFFDPVPPLARRWGHCPPLQHFRSAAAVEVVMSKGVEKALGRVVVVHKRRVLYIRWIGLYTL
jgi:hypothetical protein